MERQTVTTAFVRRYWRLVISRAYKEATMESPVRGAIMAAIVIAFASLVFWGVEQVVRDVIVSIFSSVLALLFVLAITTYRVPAELHNELGGFIESPLTVTARPKLDKPVNEQVYASLTIENISRVVVEDCVVTLDEFKDESGTERRTYPRQRNLVWSQGDGLDQMKKARRIMMNVPTVVDVANTVTNHEVVMLTQWEASESFVRGTYRATITAHGIWNGLAVETTAKFDLVYSGGNNLTIQLVEGNEKES